MNPEDLVDGPKPTGRPEVLVSLTGGFIPYKEGRPLLLNVHGSESEFIPVFETAERLVSFLTSMDIHFDGVGEIKDTKSFLEDTKNLGLHVLFNPWKTIDGTIRYMHVTEW